MECKLIVHPLAHGIFQISDAMHGPNSDGYSTEPGKATANSYLIIGEERAVLIDLALNTPELYAYAQSLAGKPILVLLTHGHPDHIYHLNTVPEAWLHPADDTMVREGIPGISFPYPDTVLHPLTDGQQIDLGGRTIKVISLPGHTMGSVLFLDQESGLLFVGDTCARRLLYGVTPTIPVFRHCEMLERLMKQDFSVMYSAHDRCALPKEYIQTILHCIREELPKAGETVMIPGVGEMKNLHWGEEDTLHYFDLAIMEQYIQ